MSLGRRIWAWVALRRAHQVREINRQFYEGRMGDEEFLSRHRALRETAQTAIDVEDASKKLSVVGGEVAKEEKREWTRTH